MMFTNNHSLNLGWSSRPWLTIPLQVLLLVVVLNLYSPRNSIECISLTTIVNPLSWYWSPTVGFRSAAAATNDQANVAKYLQMIQSFFPKNNRTFKIGSQPTATTEMPASITTTTMRWPTSSSGSDTIANDDGYGLTVTTNNIPFQDVPRTVGETIETDNAMDAITSMAPTTRAEADVLSTGTTVKAENMADDELKANLITDSMIQAIEQADHKGLYGFNNDNGILETTTANFARAQSRDEDEQDAGTTTAEPGNVQISPSLSDPININPEINMSQLETNQIQDGQLEIIERSMMIPTTTTSTTTNAGSISPKYLNEIIEREQHGSWLEQSTNMIGDDVPATTLEPSAERDNVFDLSTIDTTMNTEKHSTTSKTLPMMVIKENDVWPETVTTKPKPVTEPETVLINVNEQADVEQRTMFNSKNNVDDDGGNSFIKKFHDAYYSNSNIFDELMKRYPTERAHRAMKHFNDNDDDDDDHLRTPQELTSNDLDAINRLFFGHSHPQHSRVHFDVENP